MGQWYLPMYETIWESRRTGSPAPPGRCSHQRWPRGEGGGPEDRLLPCIRQPLAGRSAGGEGWSCQKPERRARERDEDAIKQWREKRWPHIKKRKKIQ